MPIYEYECLKCREVREVMQKFTDQPLKTCPACGGELKKIISNTSFILKGTGWYKTDYASSSKKDAKPKKEADAKKPEDTSGVKHQPKTEPKAKTEAAA